MASSFDCSWNIPDTKKKMKKSSNIIAGITLILIGVLVLLKKLGIVLIPAWSGFGTYWPIALILIGLALLLKQRLLALVLLGATLVFGLFFVADRIEHLGGPLREITQEIEYVEVDRINLDLDYGAGNIYIADGHSSFLFSNFNLDKFFTFQLLFC